VILASSQLTHGIQSMRISIQAQCVIMVFRRTVLVQCIIDLVIVYLLSLVGVDKTLEIGAA